MRTNRSYRKALSYEVATEELLRSAGIQLDPHLVQTLIDVVTPKEAPAVSPATGRASPSLTAGTAAPTTT